MFVSSISIALFTGTVTFENPGIRLELFLKEVSKQTGVEFHCPTYLNNEVLVASFKDQSIDVLKTQLARVIHGVWEQKEDGWWLVQTTEQKKEEAQWHHDLRRKVIQDLIDQAKSFVPTKEWTIQDVTKYRQQDLAMRQSNNEHVYTGQERRQFQMKAPDGRFTASVFAQLRPEMFPLDSMEPDYQLYGFRSINLAKELPIDLTDPLTMLDREKTLLAQSSGSEGAINSGQHVLIDLSNSFPILGTVLIYDKSWQFAGYGSPTLIAPNYKADGELFTPSKALAEVMEAMSFRNRFDENSPQYVSEEKRIELIWNRISDTFANATKRDPLSLLQGQAWVDYAHEMKKPLLANICDSQFTREPKYFVPTQTQTHATFYATRHDADGWVLGRPVNPLWNRTHRLDRSLLEQYVKLSKLEENATAEQQAVALSIDDFAAVYCGGIPNSRLVRFGTSARDSSISSILYGAALRAGINPDPRTGNIEISKLPSYAQGSLQIAYKQGDLTRLVSDDQNNLICAQFLMPNGIRGTFLRVTPSVEPIFEVKDEDGDVETLSLRTFAMVIREAVDDQEKLNLLTFGLGQQRHVKVSLCYGSRSIDDDLTDPPSKTIKSSWNAMPPAIRQMVLDAVQEIPPEPPQL